jgi:hypothetical protein
MWHGNLADHAKSAQDYWHHWEDVVAGFCLGLGMAYAFYRLVYPPLSGPQAGEPLLPMLESEQQQQRGGRYTDVEAAAFTEPQQL